MLKTLSPMSFATGFRNRSLAVLAATLLLASCVQDKDGDGVADARDRCPTVAAKTKDGCPAADASVAAVHFFIDKSGSMGGYYKKSAAFTNNITDLIFKVAQNDKPVDISLAAEGIEKYGGTVEQFANDIAKKEPTPGKSSQLDEIFESIAAKTDSGDISVFASDCILSFSDAEIKGNREINREKTGFLKNKINNTFNGLNKKGFGASVYAFRSGFFGTYYDYQNSKKVLNGEARPYYVWVIGNKNLLAKFDAQLANISSFKPEQELHFGLSDKPVKDYSIIPQIARKGDWMQNGDRNGIESVGDPKKAPVQFCLGLNLSSLPPYAQQLKYLNDNLKLEGQGCTVTFQAIEKKDADTKNLRSEPQKALLEKSTHLLLITITDMTLREAAISGSLPLRYDTWYASWSCDDDRDNGCSGKTFALEALITGVREAYETKNNTFIAFTVNLKK